LPRLLGCKRREPLRLLCPFPLNFPGKLTRISVHSRISACLRTPSPASCSGDRRSFDFPKNLEVREEVRNHETILLNHYDWLLDWARQLTRGASDEAEDLVQDLYVRFVQMTSGSDVVIP